MELIADRYEVLEVAGRGGQGEVLRARDRRHDRLVALKRRRLQDGESHDAMLAEARVLLGLEPHPHLPLVRDDFFTDDGHVMVMDWVDGVSLSQLLRDRGDPGLSPSAVLLFLEQAAAAIDHLHAHEPPVVHGDVKPANLIVTGRGRLVLVDFGVATRVGGAAAGGTPGFVAPETAAGRPPTPGADVYGLAATAFALLTGAAPTGIRPDWEGLDPASVPTLERALRRGLSIDPARRPATASQLVERLRSWWGAELPTGVVTFCVTDLVGSARLWDRHPGPMAAAVARHDALVAHVVEDHAGRLIKSQGEGDSTLSVFPEASSAAAAAVKIQAAMAAEDWPENIPLSMRVALHTGEAELRGGDYFGPTLNRAARLRSLAASDQILVSSTVATLVADHLPPDATLADLGEHALPDLDRTERVYELCRSDQRPTPLLSSVPPRATSSQRGANEPPMFGRGDELHELTSALESARASSGRVFLIAGEPGIGKTRLLEELEVIAEEAGVRVFWGRCHEEEGPPAFWPWVRLLESYAATVSAASLRSQLGSGLPYLTNLLPDLAERLGEIPSMPELEPKEARFRQFDAVSRFLIAASRAQPLLLFLEDLHWADTSSLLLLQFVAQELSSTAVLIVGTYRDVELTRHHPLTDTLAELARHPSTGRVFLEGLGSADVATFIAHELGRPPQSALVDAVFHQTEGNPFFVAEVVRLLSAEGRLGDENEALVGIPQGVREVIGRRLNRLSSGTIELLTLASVVGREFDARVIEASTDRPSDEVFDALEEACGARLLSEEPGSTLRYRFEHALTRQTLYEELGGVRRLRLHQRVALVLERLHGRDSSAHLSELAHHFTEASRLDPSNEAVDYSWQAADAALSLLAYEDAVDHYERALASLDRVSKRDGRARTELLVSLGDAQASAGQFVAARRSYVEGATVARRFGAPEALAKAALGFAALSAITAVDKDAVDLLESALDALPAGNNPLTARLLARLANSLYLSGDDARLETLSSQAVTMARRLDDPIVLAEALQFRHGSIRGPGVMPARLRVADEMIVLAKRAGSAHHEVQGLELRVCDLLALGDIAGVDAAMTQLLEVFEEVRGRWGVWAPRLLAMRALLDGDLAVAEQHAVESLTIGQDHQDPDALQLYGIQIGGIRREQDRAGEVTPGIRFMSEQFPEIAAWRCAVVALLAEQGEFSEARELLDALALGQFDVLPTDDFRQVSLVMLADACALMDEHGSAAVVLELLRPYSSENVVLGPAIDCCGSASRPMGVLATMLGHFDEAEDFLRRALASNRQLGSRRWVARTQVDLARCLLRRGGRGDDAEARELLRSAQRTARELGLVFINRLAEAL